MRLATIAAAAAALLLLGACGDLLEAACDDGGGGPAPGHEILPFSPHAFHAIDGDEALVHRDFGFVELDAAGSAWAPLVVAAGRRLTRVQIRAWRTAGSFDGLLVATAPDGSTTTVPAIAGTTSDSSTVGYVTLDASYLVTLAADRWYSLRVGTSVGGLQLIGARIEVEVAP